MVLPFMIVQEIFGKENIAYTINGIVMNSKLSVKLYKKDWGGQCSGYYFKLLVSRVYWFYYSMYLFSCDIMSPYLEIWTYKCFKKASVEQSCWMGLYLLHNMWANCVWFPPPQLFVDNEEYHSLTLIVIPESERSTWEPFPQIFIQFIFYSQYRTMCMLLFFNVHRNMWDVPDMSCVLCLIFLMLVFGLHNAWIWVYLILEVCM